MTVKAAVVHVDLHDIEVPCSKWSTLAKHTRSAGNHKQKSQKYDDICTPISEIKTCNCSWRRARATHAQFNSSKKLTRKTMTAGIEEFFWHSLCTLAEQNCYLKEIQGDWWRQPRVWGTVRARSRERFGFPPTAVWIYNLKVILPKKKAADSVGGKHQSRDAPTCCVKRLQGQLMNEIFIWKPHLAARSKPGCAILESLISQHFLLLLVAPRCFLREGASSQAADNRSKARDKGNNGKDSITHTRA